MNRTTTLTIAGVAACTVLAYAVYFDYKRRNDVNFRRKLRKEKKRVDKTVTQDRANEAASSQLDPEDLRLALEKLRDEVVPEGQEEKERYFMNQVSIGEQLCTQGPAFYLPAALSFYRALRVYPSPVELIVIYQKTVPEPIFGLIMQMTNLDVKDRVEGYYKQFPPKAMKVSVEDLDVPDGTGAVMRKKIMVANEDFKAGDIIYKEQPIVTVLDFDLQGTGSHCSYCLRHIQKGMAIRPPNDRLDSVYCSKDCQVKSNTQFHNLLFTLESPLPPEVAPELTSEAKEDRNAVQTAYVEHIKKAAASFPLLVARFVGRQVANETAKMIPGGGSALSSEPALADGGDYTLYDHVERLRYLEVPTPEGEVLLFRDVLEKALPGLEQFVTDERYTTLLGKMAYNAYGVCFGGGRDDKPASTLRPEDMERTRTPYGTTKQVGSGLYAVSAYIQHSCAPSARPSFSGGTSELHLIANHNIKKGEEITVSYVDATQHTDEIPVECRRRRRQELARGWRFACACTRCAEETTSEEDSKEESIKDESKVEEVVSRLEAEQPSAERQLD